MAEWQRSGPEPGKDYSGIWYDTAGGVAKITINRPEVPNAFRPATLFELSRAFTFKEKRAPDFGAFPRRP